MFFGRAVVVPEIPIWIVLESQPRHGNQPPVNPQAKPQATLVYVSVGTTVANVIERYAAIPLDPDQGLVSMTRVSTLPVEVPGQTLNSLDVDFGAGTGGALDPGVFDLPLIGGDAITFNLG